jgi:hypothetical protein
MKLLLYASFSNVMLSQRAGPYRRCSCSRLKARGYPPIFWTLIEPVSTESTIKEQRMDSRPRIRARAHGNARIAVRQSPVTHLSEVS